MTHDTNDTSTNGNTKIIRARIWCWTWNNYDEGDLTEMELFCKSECSTFAFQEETGENGTEHLQGYWEFKNARTFQSLKKKWPKTHIEKCRNKEAALKYCQKEETRTGNSYTSIKKVKDRLEGLELREWQKEIVEIIKTEPDPRKIYWYYDRTGNTGKTSLAKHLCLKYPGEVLYMSGKASDVKYGIMCFQENKENNLRVVIFDYVRSIESFVSYEAIETVKNGIFFNNKYESKMVVYDEPHVIIFANFAPDQSKLSKDRWVIRDITIENEIEDDLDELDINEVL